jgi:uncharacterized protein
VILDTGVLYAAMAPRDRHHAACAKLLRATRELLPAPVLVELDYFLSQLTGSHRPFDEVLRRIENGVFTVLDLAVGDYFRVRDLCTQYGDWPLGFVDAAVVILAERERQTRIATFDRRHFAAIKPRPRRGVRVVPVHNASLPHCTGRGRTPGFGMPPTSPVSLPESDG